MSCLDRSIHIYKSFQKLFGALIVFVFMSRSFAEDLRLTSVYSIDLSRTTQNVSVRYGAAVIVRPDPSIDFLQGFEIEIKQGSSSLNFPNSLEYQVYRCKNDPEQNNFIYGAVPIEKNLLPARVSTVLQFPTREKHTLHSSAYAKVLPYIFKKDDGYIIIRIMPIMKGLSTEFEESLFTISVKPLFTNEGGVNANIIFPQNHGEVKITLNETPVTLPAPPKFFTLPVGNYQLVLEAEGYRTELRTVTIKQAEVVTMDFKLRSITPLLYVYVPDEVQVTLDRQVLDMEQIPVELSVGSHTVKLQLGAYELLRQIDAEEGKTYTITMNIGVDVTVED